MGDLAIFGNSLLIHSGFEPSPEEIERQKERQRLDDERRERRARERRAALELPDGAPWHMIEALARGETSPEIELGKQIESRKTELTPIDFSHFLDSRMEVVKGHNEIYERLKTLGVGEIACIRFLHVYTQSKRRDGQEFRFRKWINYDEPSKSSRGGTYDKCEVLNRDKSHDKLLDHNSVMHESCFSDWTESIAYNVERMGMHDSDGSSILAEEMVIIQTLDMIEEKAWLYLQSGLHTHERLQWIGCSRYQKLKEEGRLYASTPWIAPEAEQTTLDSYLASTGSEPVHSNAYWDIPF